MTQSNDSRAKAQARLEAILKVRSGQLTACAAAELLGISRKTWYEWENRGLEAMIEALTDRDPGRPAIRPDPEKAALVQELVKVKTENILLQERLEINRLLNQANCERNSSGPGRMTTTKPAGKKKPAKHRSRRKPK